MKEISIILERIDWPPEILILDFEIFFNDDYNLKNLSEIEYVSDSRFRFTGLGFQALNCPLAKLGPTFTGGFNVSWMIERLKWHFGKGLHNCTVVTKNTKFDNLILAKKFNLYPPYTIDIEDLSRYYDSRMSQKLKDLCKLFKLPDKGDTNQFKGLYWETMSPEQKQAMKEYCLGDIKNEKSLFEILLPALQNPNFELNLARHTLNLYLRPFLKLDSKLAIHIDNKMEQVLSEKLAKVAWVLKYRNKKYPNVQKILASRKIFPKILQDVLPKGEQVPMKKGKNEMIPALAQEDVAFQLLLVHQNKKVRDLCQAKAACSSWPLHQKKVQQMIRNVECDNGSLRIPLKFHGAHCVSPDTEVLTPYGWRYICEWDSRIPIIQWEPCGKLTWCNAQKHETDQVPELCYMNASRAKGAFSAGHKLGYFTHRNKFHIIEVGNAINKQLDKLPLSGVYDGNGSITPDQMRILVMVQADGHWKLSKEKGNYLIFGFRKQYKINKCQQLLNGVNIPYKIRLEKSGTTRIICRMVDLPNWLNPERKIFGAWLLDSTFSARIAFFDELHWWDGWLEKNSKGFGYSSTIKQNAEWVQIIGHLTNYAVSIKKRESKNKNWADSYRCFISNIITSQISPRHWTIRPYKGSVYCPITQTGYWLMRYKNKVCITHNTGRWTGTGWNPMNLGGKGRGKPIHPLIAQVRNTLIAPDDNTLLIVDSAQIEARETAWTAHQNDLVKGFTNGEDIYSQFASKLFQEKVWKPTEEEKKTPEGKTADIRRSFGKDAILGCIAKGSQALTNNGWKSIETITTNDLLWDGVEWVTHQGVIYQGKKQCINVNGVWMTPEHEILQKGGWITAAELNMNNRQSGNNTENLQLQKLNMDSMAGLSPSNVVAPVVESLLQQETIWSGENLHAVMSVLKRHPAKLRAIKHLLKNHIKVDCLIEFVQSLAGVKRNHIKIMANEVLEFGPIGLQIELLFLSIWHRYQDGIIQNLKLTGLTTIEDMNLIILDLPHEVKIVEIQDLTILRESEQKLFVNGAGKNLRDGGKNNNIAVNIVPVMLPTYDIISAGPKKRFQVGNLLVGNCSYGMGANTFFDKCRQNDTLRPLFDSGEYNWNFIDRLIKTYRKTYANIPAFWREIERCFRIPIKYPTEKTEYKIHDNGRICFWKSEDILKMQLPSGRIMNYRHARLTKDGTIKYLHGTLWAGIITENIIQAMCRDLLGYWLLKCEENNIPIVLHSYDELVGCVPVEQAEDKLQQMINIMCTAPKWAEGLPLAAEGQISECYTK